MFFFRKKKNKPTKPKPLHTKIDFKSLLDASFDKKKMLEQIEAMSDNDLAILRDDMPNWTNWQRNYFGEILMTATDFQKTTRLAKILFADRWLLQTNRTPIYDIYLPIFLFSIFPIRVIDHTYRSSVLPKVKALSPADLQILKSDAIRWTKSQQEELQLIIGYTENYDNLYQHLLINRHSKTWLTQSNNQKILAIYKIVVESEGVDTDYWWCGIGASDMGRVFASFNATDWQELEADLKHWTNFQLEMFTYGILDEGAYPMERFNLIIPLLKIGKLLDRQYNDIALTVLEEMENLNAHFEELFKIDKNIIPKIKEIFELLGVEEYDKSFSTLKKKIYG
jgi:hypothetical protein